jgi:hypothetical protein
MVRIAGCCPLNRLRTDIADGRTVSWSLSANNGK